MSPNMFAIYLWMQIVAKLSESMFEKKRFLQIIQEQYFGVRTKIVRVSFSLSLRAIRILIKAFQDDFACIPVFMQDDKMTLIL